MYRLIKDFIKMFLCGTGLIIFIGPLWSLIEFLINVLIKIVVVFPVYLCSQLLNFTKLKIANFISNTNVTNDKIQSYRYVIAIIFFIIALFWLYCTYALFKGSAFASQQFMQSVTIFGLNTK